MGHWNYRLIRQDSEWGCWYALHEVYYDDEGQPNGWTENSIAPRGETFPDAHRDYLMMAEAFNHLPFVVVGGDKLELESYDG